MIGLKKYFLTWRLGTTAPTRVCMGAGTCVFRMKRSGSRGPDTSMSTVAWGVSCGAVCGDSTQHSRSTIGVHVGTSYNTPGPLSEWWSWDYFTHSLLARIIIIILNMHVHAIEHDSGESVSPSYSSAYACWRPNCSTGLPVLRGRYSPKQLMNFPTNLILHL